MVILSDKDFIWHCITVRLICQRFLTSFGMTRVQECDISEGVVGVEAATYPTSSKTNVLSF